MGKRERVHGAVLQRILSDNEYAYLYLYSGDELVCEGTVRSLSKLMNLRAFSFKSFFVMNTEDGGVEIEACV